MGEKQTNRPRKAVISAIVGTLLLSLGLRSSREETPPAPQKSALDLHIDRLMQNELDENFRRLAGRRFLPDYLCGSGFRQYDPLAEPGDAIVKFSKCSKIQDQEDEIKSPAPSASEPISELDL